MPRLFGRDFTKAELLRHIGHLYQIGGVQLSSSEDGPSRGVRFLEFRTGTGFIFKVAVERGMDVAYCEYQGSSLAWIAPSVFPGPWYFEQQTEFGWLRTALGGLCNSCGMVHIGNPETDSVAHYNFPARPTERYGVHDRMALLPAKLEGYGEHWEGEHCVLEAKGRVVQAQAYGENLVLTRRYTARLGESRFFLHDEIENVGYLPTVHMLLYHINLGFPFVSQTSELVAPIVPPARLLFGEIDPNQPEQYTRFSYPKRDCLFEGLEFTMAGEADGRVPVALCNSQLGAEGRAVYVIYNLKQMPLCLEWRMMGEGQYAVGIEPATNSFGREQVRSSGQMIILAPGEKRVYDLEIGVMDTAREIEAFRARVDGLRKSG